MKTHTPTILAVIGLGYVGLPLAVEFAAHFPVIGFDVDEERVKEINAGKDRTAETDTGKLKQVLRKPPGKADRTPGLICTTQTSLLGTANVFIVTVPTPIDRYNAPDLSFLLDATAMVAKYLKKGGLVVYESTVYPGCTEEECVPILERYSGLKYNRGFFVGYSPERINPGDKVHTLTSIKKITSGSTPKAAENIDDLYKKIIKAGTHRAPNIKVAEAAKAIENAQRDLNISFVNELALLFDRMDIDTTDVLEAAATKYNFHHYKPGLVGGHCISVDPYYLLHKATQLGYHPQVILSGRRVNDFMPEFVAAKVVKLMIAKGHKIKGARALVMGITFKEDCPDVRNTKVVKIYEALCGFGMQTDIFDPFASRQEVKREYGLKLLSAIKANERYHAVIVAVAHSVFKTINLKNLLRRGGVVFDAKSIMERHLVDGRL